MDSININKASKYKSKVLDTLNKLKNIIKPGRFIYHSSNPLNREFIKNNGLVARGSTDSWLADTDIDGKALFFSNTNKIDEFFDSGYNDDIYKIDTSKLNDQFFSDPNFSKNSNLIYCKGNIGNINIKLIHEGNGDNCDDGPEIICRLKEIKI